MFGVLTVAATVGCGPGAPTVDQPMLTTRAERTRYEQTTGYGEVVRFMQRAATLSGRVHFHDFWEHGRGTTATAHCGW